MMKGKPQIFVVLVIAILGLTACGQIKLPDVVDTPSISVSAEGEITAFQVDVFDKDYYQVSELMSMAVEEAAEYNTAHQSGDTVPVRVEKVEALEDGSGKIVVNSIYQNGEVYSDYNETFFFYGTMGEAVAAGVDLDGVFQSVKDGTILSDGELGEDTKRHLIVTQERVKVYCPYQVTHISNNVVISEDGSVDATASEGTVMILMKN